MSRMGIGSATIDLVLNDGSYRIGECIKGKYVIKGGTIEQKIKRIESDLVQIQNKDEDDIKLIVNNSILSSTTILSEEERVISFSCALPGNLPVSDKNTSYRFVTRLIFDNGVNSIDHDEIIIQS